MTFRTALLIALLFVAHAAVAAPPGPRGPDMDRLALLLDLDDYQRQQVEAIFDAQQEAREAQRETFEASGERPDREAMRTAHEQAKAELRSQLAGVLSAVQLEKFDALMDMPPRPGRPRGPHGPKDLPEDLPEPDATAE